MSFLRRFRQGAALLGAGLLLAGAATTQGLANKPVTIVVPFAPGGGPDLVARKIAVKLASGLGVPVLVDNRDGAGGRIGTAAVARATPDGHTLLLGTSSALTLAPALYRELPYDAEKAFAPVGLIVRSPLVLSVRSDLPVTDVRSLVAYARQEQGRVNYGSVGIGSLHHVASEMLKRAAGIDMTHVPYKGGAPAWLALSRREVDVIVDVIFGGAMQTLASGKARAIAVTGERHINAYPAVKTFREQGIEGMEVTSWWGLLAPAGTPPAVVASINRELRAALADPELVASFAALGLDLESSTPEGLGRLMASDLKHWREAATAMKLKLD